MTLLQKAKEKWQSLGTMDILATCPNLAGLDNTITKDTCDKDCISCWEREVEE